MRRYILLAGIALGIVSCSSDYAFDRELERMRASALEKIDVEECKAKGGHIEGVGMFATPACVVPYGDAREDCSDNSECEGRCLVDLDGLNPPQQGDHVVGYCEPSNATFGCVAEVQNGAVGQGICQD